MKKYLSSAFHNPLSYVGGAVFLFNVALIIFLIIVQMLMKRPAPHADMLIFILLPGVSILGLVVAIIGVVRERHRRKAGGGEERRFPVIDLNDPRRRNSFYVLGGGLVLLCLLYAFAGIRPMNTRNRTPFAVSAM